jgi:hypothetical protein
MSEPELPLGSRDLDASAAAAKSPIEPGEFRPSLPEDDMKRHGISESDHIYPEHRDYLMRRHGTLDLNPLPSVDPADPLNWTQTKVYLVGPDSCQSSLTYRALCPPEKSQSCPAVRQWPASNLYCLFSNPSIRGAVKGLTPVRPEYHLSHRLAGRFSHLLLESPI